MRFGQASREDEHSSTRFIDRLDASDPRRGTATAILSRRLRNRQVAVVFCIDFREDAFLCGSLQHVALEVDPCVQLGAVFLKSLPAIAVALDGVSEQRRVYPDHVGLKL